MRFSVFLLTFATSLTLASADASAQYQRPGSGATMYSGGSMQAELDALRQGQLIAAARGLQAIGRSWQSRNLSTEVLLGNLATDSGTARLVSSGRYGPAYRSLQDSMVGREISLNAALTGLSSLERRIASGERIDYRSAQAFLRASEDEMRMYAISAYYRDAYSRSLHRQAHLSSGAVTIITPSSARESYIQRVLDNRVGSWEQSARLANGMFYLPTPTQAAKR